MVQWHFFFWLNSPRQEPDRFDYTQEGKCIVFVLTLANGCLVYIFTFSFFICVGKLDTTRKKFKKIPRGFIVRVIRWSDMSYMFTKLHFVCLCVGTSVVDSLQLLVIAADDKNLRDFEYKLRKIEEMQEN